MRAIPGAHPAGALKRVQFRSRRNCDQTRRERVGTPEHSDGGPKGVRRRDAPSNTATSTSNEKATLAVAFFIDCIFRTMAVLAKNGQNTVLSSCNTHMVYIDSRRLEEYLLDY